MIDKYGTRCYIKQQGQLGVTLHQNVLTALDHWELRYQNSKFYEELEDERLLDEAIDEMGTVPCPTAGGNGKSRVNVEEQLKKKLGKCQIILEVHGVPLGRKGEGVTRLIYENLKGKTSEYPRLDPPTF